MTEEQIVNDKEEDKIRAETRPSKEFIEKHRHYCKTCKDNICCERGKDKWAYCCGGEE